MAETLVGETGEIYEQVVADVAARADVDPAELPPLFDAVDPDGLETIFAPTLSGDSRVGTVTFPYAGYDVTVEFDDDSSPIVTVD